MSSAPTTAYRRFQQALERHEFALYFQPQVDLQTGDIVAVEALLRWVRDGETVPASDFVPELEDSGLIIDVGAWVLQAACEAAVTLQMRFGRAVRVATNVSARQFSSGTFAEEVAAALRASGAPPSSLEIELTERLLVRDTELTVACLTALADLGVRIAIDDFGTGFSALSYLYQFPVHVVKMDRPVVASIDTHERGAAVAEAVIGLGHRLGLEVVAEGVESRGQFAFLAGAGCDRAQGYYISRPVPLRDIVPGAFRDHLAPPSHDTVS